MNPCGVYKKTGHVVHACGFEVVGVQSIVGTYILVKLLQM